MNLFLQKTYLIDKKEGVSRSLIKQYRFWTYLLQLINNAHANIFIKLACMVCAIIAATEELSRFTL